jgi:hypothetical protein
VRFATAAALVNELVEAKQQLQRKSQSKPIYPERSFRVQV